MLDKPHGLELVDIPRLCAWMEAQGLGAGPIEDVTQLTGGSQNVILRFRKNSRAFVLRRPPLHPTWNGSETMRREARVLAALAGTDVPHARLIVACPDEHVLGAAFYLMEPVEGFNPAAGLPPLHAGSVAIRRRMSLNIADALAALARVDYRAAGLADLGRLDGFLERQVPRWRAQLKAYSDHPGWPGPGEIPGVEEVGAWLEANRPKDFTPGIMHGDYHLKNLLFRHDGPEIAAVVDWELTTIGDPLIDVGWLVATWRPPGEDASSATIVIEPWEGFPEAQEVVARYGELTGRDMSAMSWYAVFACYKLGIILEGSHARACAGKAPREIGLRLHGNAIRLFTRALGWIEAS